MEQRRGCSPGPQALASGLEAKNAVLCSVFLFKILLGSWIVTGGYGSVMTLMTSIDAVFIVMLFMIVIILSYYFSWGGSSFEAVLRKATTRRKQALLAPQVRELQTCVVVERRSHAPKRHIVETEASVCVAICSAPMMALSNVNEWILYITAMTFLRRWQGRPAIK